MKQEKIKISIIGDWSLENQVYYKDMQKIDFLNYIIQQWECNLLTRKLK